MYIIGAYIDSEISKVALYDSEYKLVSRRDSSDDIKDLCLEIMAEEGIGKNEIGYIGIAAKDSDAIASRLENELGIKCYGSSVISARALGEAFTSGDLSTLVLLKIDDTVECGIVIDKKIYNGVDGKGGMVAHFVIDCDGYECRCGRRGCFEASATDVALKRIAADAGVEGAENITPKALYAIDSPEADKAKETYKNYLACGITNVINLFQPRELVLEGEYTEVGYQLMAPLMDFLLREQYTHSAPNKCNVRTPNNESDTALIGAALLGR